MIRMLGLVACGTRTIIDATFGTSSVGETTYTRDLLRALHPGMIVLADRNSAAPSLIAAIVDTGADLLVRVKNGRKLPVCRRLRNGSYVSRIGPVEVQVICCEITIATTAGRQTGVYRLITMILDPDCPAAEIVALYHDRWEIEVRHESHCVSETTEMEGRGDRRLAPGECSTLVPAPGMRRRQRWGVKPGRNPKNR